MQISIIYVNAT